MLLHLSTWAEIEDFLTRSKTVVIPIGSNEQHGPTGLLGTDEGIGRTIGSGMGTGIVARGGVGSGVGPGTGGGMTVVARDDVVSTADAVVTPFDVVAVGDVALTVASLDFASAAGLSASLTFFSLNL